MSHQAYHRAELCWKAIKSLKRGTSVDVRDWTTKKRKNERPFALASVEASMEHLQQLGLIDWDKKTQVWFAL